MSFLQDAWRRLGESDEDAMAEGTARAFGIDIDTGKKSQNKSGQQKAPIVKPNNLKTKP